MTKAKTTLNLSDPDSTETVPAAAPRFAGDLLLDSQGDAQQVYLAKPGTGQKKATVPLDVVESWNRANQVIFYGKGGDLATNRRDEQEMSVLCLRILQSALVYVNTLMLQSLLVDPEWADVLTAEDQRGLTPLFWSHVLPYGEVKLNMTSRLPLSTT